MHPPYPRALLENCAEPSGDIFERGRAEDGVLGYCGAAVCPAPGSSLRPRAGWSQLWCIQHEAALNRP